MHCAIDSMPLTQLRLSIRDQIHRAQNLVDKNDRSHRRGGISLCLSTQASRCVYKKVLEHVTSFATSRCKEHSNELAALSALCSFQHCQGTFSSGNPANHPIGIYHCQSVSVNWSQTPKLLVSLSLSGALDSRLSQR